LQVFFVAVLNGKHKFLCFLSAAGTFKIFLFFCFSPVESSNLWLFYAEKGKISGNLNVFNDSLAGFVHFR
jgi:hypothetical protein